MGTNTRNRKDKGRPGGVAILGIAGVIALLTPAACLAQGFIITTVAGGGFSAGPLPAPATTIFLNDEEGVAVDSAGNIYFAGGVSNVVYKVSGGQLSVVAGKGAAGYSGDGGPAASALLDDPQGVAVDSSGILYITDYLNNVVREVSAGGTITTIAGNGTNSTPTDGPALASPLNQPIGIAVDTAGNVYFTTGISGGHIMKLASGTLTTVAGNGILGPVTNGMPATSQPVQSPHGVAVDAAGNLYIATSSGGTILRVNAADGTISIVAGAGTFGGPLGDGGPALSASITPFGIAVDSAGNLYITDPEHYAVREVSNGIINTIAGTDKLGSACSTTSVPATSVGINNPSGIALGSGKIYFSEASGCIRALGGASVSGPPSITPSGIVSASQFGQFTSVAPGSWIEIYGANFATDSRSWATADFKGASAPKSLDGTSVTVGGQAAFVDYISPGQVNAQVPSNAPGVSQPVVVTTPNGVSPPVTVTVNQNQPGLLAPSNFSIGGTQYVAALFSDGVTYVLPPGSISGVTSRHAKPGDTITVYGIGFGPVTPAISAGQIVQQANTLAASIQFSLGGTLVAPAYAGLASGFVGLYQFNIVVPNMAPNDKVPFTFFLGGAKGTQTLYTSVGN